MRFVPISVDAYVELRLKGKSAKEKMELAARLRETLARYHAGARCQCGEPIWVLGSAEVGHTCFTCATGETDPSEDYEIVGSPRQHRSPKRALRTRSGRK